MIPRWIQHHRFAREVAHRSYDANKYRLNLLHGSLKSSSRSIFWPEGGIWYKKGTGEKAEDLKSKWNQNKSLAILQKCTPKIKGWKNKTGGGDETLSTGISTNRELGWFLPPSFWLGKRRCLATRSQIIPKGNSHHPKLSTRNGLGAVAEHVLYVKAVMKSWKKEIVLEGRHRLSLEILY